MSSHRWFERVHCSQAALAALAFAAMSCMPEPHTPPDDGGPRRDDAGEAGVPVDCPTTWVSGGVCRYSGYGTVCDIPCAFPPTCTYDVIVTWSGGGYCCSSYESSYRNCRCEDGQTICQAYPEPQPPTSTCEFCDLDFGVDAGPGDAVDLGSDCPARPLGHDCMASGYAGACEVWSCIYPEPDGGVLCYVGTACTSDADCTCPGPCVRGVCR